LGVALGTPRLAKANDTGAFIGGLVAGALLSGIFDRDYPRGISYSGEPVWYFYPQVGVYAFPTWARPYPYGQRYWILRTDFQGRPVFVPAPFAPYGPSQVVRFRIGRGGPIFLLQTGRGPVGGRYDRDDFRHPYPGGWYPGRTSFRTWDRDWQYAPRRDWTPEPRKGWRPPEPRKHPDPGRTGDDNRGRSWRTDPGRDRNPNQGGVKPEPGHDRNPNQGRTSNDDKHQTPPRRNAGDD